LLVNAPAFAIVLVGLQRGGRWEQRVMVDELAPEIGTPTVTEAEYARLQHRAEPPHDRIGREIFHAQCNLAKRKAMLHLHEQTVDDDPVVEAWRGELGSLRLFLPAGYERSLDR
jgi:hypothetical protein